MSLVKQLQPLLRDAALLFSRSQWGCAQEFLPPEKLHLLLYTEDKRGFPNWCFPSLPPRPC